MSISTLKIHNTKKDKQKYPSWGKDSFIRNQYGHTPAIVFAKPTPKCYFFFMLSEEQWQRKRLHNYRNAEILMAKMSG